MPDNLKIRHPEDGAKININQNWEVRDWATKLNVTEGELKKAVHTVGHMVKDVKRHLGK